MRIVSLLPSATEIICELGLEDCLVGVTHECDYPEFVRKLPKVTRTLIPTQASSREIDLLVRERMKTRRALYTLDFGILEQLKPDLIVTQALCDVCAVAEAEVNEAACQLPGRPQVVNLEPMRLAEVFACLQHVGDAAGISDRARNVTTRLKDRVTAVEIRSQNLSVRPSVVQLEWIDPPFCAGHWSPELVRLAGGHELIGLEAQPSRTTAWEEILRADPDFMIIACCGFDVERTLHDLDVLVQNPLFHQLKCARDNQIHVIDGSAYFNRPGPRLVDSLEILAHTLHPEIHALPAKLPKAYRVTSDRQPRSRSLNGNQI